MNGFTALQSVAQFALLNIFAFLLAVQDFTVYAALATNVYICAAAVPAYGLVLAGTLALKRFQPSWTPRTRRNRDPPGET